MRDCSLFRIRTENRHKPRRFARAKRRAYSSSSAPTFRTDVPRADDPRAKTKTRPVRVRRAQLFLPVRRRRRVIIIVRVPVHRVRCFMGLHIRFAQTRKRPVFHLSLGAAVFTPLPARRRLRRHTVPVITAVYLLCTAERRRVVINRKRGRIAKKKIGKTSVAFSESIRCVFQV